MSKRARTIVGDAPLFARLTRPMHGAVKSDRFVWALLGFMALASVVGILAVLALKSHTSTPTTKPHTAAAAAAIVL